MHSFYAFRSMHCVSITNFETRWRRTDRPTDQPTDRRTLSYIELLSQLKILHWNKETFRDESLKSQQLVGVNQAGISVFPNLS
jgi:hypothetical protein